MKVSYSIASDQTAYLANWYARTNLLVGEATSEVRQALHAWASATSIDLVVGCSPVHRLPLAVLLDRQPGQMAPDTGCMIDHLVDLKSWQESRDRGDRPSGRAARAVFGDALAERLYRASFDTSPDDNAIIEHQRNAQAWNDLSLNIKRYWKNIARVARDELEHPLLAVVPVRQIFGLTVQTDPSALGALLEVLPTNVAPQALVWVHLEGIAGRFVA